MILSGFFTSLALAYTGWTALSLAMDRHYADIHGRGKEPDARTRRICRTIGSILLAAAFLVCVKLQGWTVGSVLCLGVMTAGGLLLVLLLTYAPQRTMLGGKIAAFAAMIGGAIWML